MSAQKNKKYAWTFGDITFLVFLFPEGGATERVVGNVAGELSGPVLSDPL